MIYTIMARYLTATVVSASAPVFNLFVGLGEAFPRSHPLNELIDAAAPDDLIPPGELMFGDR